MVIEFTKLVACYSTQWSQWQGRDGKRILIVLGFGWDYKTGEKLLQEWRKKTEWKPRQQ